MPSHPSVTIGIDVGDRYSHLCVLDDESGEVIEESRITTSPAAFERRFSDREHMRVAIEAGTHSLWISRILENHGHEVLVANARKLRLIYAEGNKNDKLDAENLARLARLDPKLLAPIEHRNEISQAHLTLLRSRECAPANALPRGFGRDEDQARQPRVRGAVKSFGMRLPKCSPQSFHHKVRDLLPGALLPALAPILEFDYQQRP